MKPTNTIILIIIVAVLGAVAYWFLADDTATQNPSNNATSTASTTPTLNLNLGVSTTPVAN